MRVLKNKTPSAIQCRDTVLAFTFLFLLVWFFTKNTLWVHIAMGVLLAGMVFPSAMRWPARVWFGFSHCLGLVMSRVLLTVIYVLILLPVSLVRKVMGKDAMRLRGWKDGSASAFVARDHSFGKEDLQNPF